jgi:hypothetical protein
MCDGAGSLRHLRTLTGAAAIVLVFSNPILAKDVWSGKNLPDLLSAKSKIATECGKVTGQPEQAAAYMAAMESQKSRLSEFLKSLVENTKSVEAATKANRLDDIKKAVANEAKKVTISLSCNKSSGTLDMNTRVKNGDGVEIKLNPSGF